jgi:hypothetical protein
MDWVTGDKELDRALNLLGKKANSIAASGIRAALNEVKKGIQSELPTRLRRAVGSRFKKRRAGRVEAKAGGAVGNAHKYAGQRPSGTGRPGVGISGNNIHWYLAGTEPRRATRLRGKSLRKSRYTGSMPSVAAVPRGYAKSERWAMEAARKKMRERIIKLAKQHAKKARG